MLSGLSGNLIQINQLNKESNVSNKIPDETLVKYKNTLTSSISVRLPLSTKERVYQIAKDNDITVSAVMNIAVDTYISNLNKEE